MLLNELAYVHGDTVVSAKMRFAWLCVPKVASRTFLWLFSDRFGQTNSCEGQRLINHPDWPARTIEIPSDYFRFAFVRNPYDRVASVWLDKFRNFNPKREKWMSKWVGLSPESSFADFVKWLGPEARNADDPHWRAQYLFVTSKSGTLQADFIGKLERLEEDLQHVRTKIGLSSDQIPKLNSREGENRKYSLESYDELYTDELRQIIGRRYARDFELFDYPLSGKEKARAS